MPIDETSKFHQNFNLNKFSIKTFEKQNIFHAHKYFVERNLWLSVCLLLFGLIVKTLELEPDIFAFERNLKDRVLDIRKIFISNTFEPSEIKAAANLCMKFKNTTKQD